MKKHEVKVGGRYVAKVSDKLTLVRIDRENPRGGWDATNEKTGKAVRVKSAQRLRSAVRDHAKETAEVLGHGREAAEAKAATKAALAAGGGGDATGGNGGGQAAARAGTKVKKTAEAKAERKPGLLTLAAEVLKDAAAPMDCKTIVLEIIHKGLWETQGKTPAATLYAAIIREIAAKGGQARFRKVAAGRFELNAA